MNGKRAAVIVQRWYPGVTGGSEQLAFAYTQYLKEVCDVDLITTTAKDALTWQNELDPGESEAEGVRVLRFPVVRERDAHWHELHRLLLQAHHVQQSEPVPESYNYFTDTRPPFPWTAALQEEWIRRQGPHSPELVAQLQARAREYDALIFVTYLYAPTYFGSRDLVHPNMLLVPTLHDEVPAHFPVFREMSRRFRACLWNTETERDVGARLWNNATAEQHLVSMGLHTEPATPDRIADARKRYANDEPYLLYSGRIDTGKGCDHMLDFFLQWRAQNNTSHRLILTGALHDLALPSGDAVRYAGFVPEADKFALMAGADAFLMPSRNESLSIVTLEAMAQNTPFLAHGDSPVLMEHLRRAGGGGAAFLDAPTFSARLNEIIGAPEEYRGKGRQYVLDHFAHASVRQRLFSALGW